MANHKSDLSYPQQQLVELMQEINFGRIENLVVRDAEPDIAGARVTRDIVFGKDNASHPTRAKTDFVLKETHVELFRFMSQRGTLTIETLVVQHGLPVRMTVSHRS